MKQLASCDAAAAELILFEAGETGQLAHGEHVRLAFEMLRRYRFTEAAARISSALRKMATEAGRPQVYHETITVAFMAGIAERMQKSRGADWARFVAANPELQRRDFLSRWYPAEVLRSEAARATFLLPPPALGDRGSEVTRGRGFGENVSSHGGRRSARRYTDGT